MFGASHRHPLVVAAAVLLVASGRATAAPPPAADLHADYHLVRFGAREGLPGGTFTALLQRRSKHLVAAAGNRLLSFDGVRARPLPVGASADSEIVALAEDATGALWVGMLRGPGVVRIGATAVRTFTRADGLPDHDATSLCFTPAGELWAGTDAGLARFDGQRFHAVPVAGVAARHRVRTVACAPDGDVWVSFMGGPLRRLRRGAVVAAPGAEVLEQHPVRRVLFARDGAVWLGGMEGGLFRLHDGRLTPVATEGLPGGRVKALLEDRRGRIWVGTWGGGVALLASRPGGHDVVTGAGVDVVSELVEDHEGAIWVAGTTGLAQLRARSVFPLGAKDGLSSGLVRALAQTPDGAVWVGTNDGGVNRLHRGTITAVRREHGLPSDNVTALAVDRDGALLVGTDRGACRLRGDACRAIDGWASLDGHEMRGLHADRAGALWAVTRAGALVQSVGGRLVHHEGRVRVAFTAAFVEDAEGLWLGTGGTIHRWDGATWTAAHRLPGDGGRIHGLSARAGGGLWVASTVGLSLLGRSGLRTWGAAEALPIPVTFAVEDGRGSLWMGTRDGLLRAVAPDDAAPVRPLAFRAFGTEEGLASGDFGHPASPPALRATGGDLWFAAAEETVRVDPSRVDARAGPTPVSVEAITADGRALPPVEPVRVPPGTERLEIEYTALAFRAPGRTRFRFLLEGFDKQWIDGGTGRSAVYTRLPPGDYVFKLTASDLEGGWAQRGAALRIRRPPLPHERASVRLLALALVIAAASAAVHAVRVRRVRARFAAITDERNRIARELHDTLEQGLTSVALHVKAAEKSLGDADGARAHLAASHAVLEHVQVELRHDLWDLRGRGETHADLPSALHEAARELRSTTGLRVQVQVTGGPAAPGPAVETALLRIAQAALANVVRHAEATAVDVALDLSDARQVRLEVRDDGRGFHAPEGAARDHLGLAGMRQRAERLGGALVIDSAPGRGTTVRVTMPLRRTA